MPRVSLQLLLALVLVLAASYYWKPGTEQGADPETSARRKLLPQTYLYAVRSWSYSEEGSLANILEADQAEYFSHDDQTRMQAPRFYSHNGDDKTWSAAAVRGRLHNASKKLLLQENVFLSHDQTGGRLETSEMFINIEKKIATSFKPVTITQGLHRTVADGMVAKLEEEQILLKTNVESIHHVPPQP
jgi:LPS export ABC transporter protein LptC